MQLLTILLALPLITALPACPPTSAVPSPSPSPKPPVSYLGRRLLFQYTLQKCMVAKGNWVGAEVGLSTDCINEVPTMHWDTGPPGTVGPIRLHDTDLCLDAGNWNTRGDGVKLTLQTCSQFYDYDSAQVWFYPINGKVELAGHPPRSHAGPEHSKLCLDLTDGTPLATSSSGPATQATRTRFGTFLPGASTAKPALAAVVPSNNNGHCDRDVIYNDGQWYYLGQS